MYTLQDFLVASKAVGYVIAAVFLIGFILFWRFVAGRYRNGNVIAAVTLLFAFCIMAVLWFFPPGLGTPPPQAVTRATKEHQKDELLLVTSTHDPREAPELIVIDDLTDIYVPVVFAHRLHANMGGGASGCEVCHHRSKPGEMPACKECHKPTVTGHDLRQPSLKGAYHRQCMGCHREWSHGTECTVCHAKRKPGDVMEQIRDRTDIIGAHTTEIVSPETIVYRSARYPQGPIVTFFHNAHIEQFGLKCVQCHRQEGCGRCHAGIGKTVKPKPKTQEEVHAVCSNCHAKDRCTMCHESKERTARLASYGAKLGKLNLGLTFVRGAGSPGPVVFRHDAHLTYGIKCSDCHPSLYKMARVKTATARGAVKPPLAKGLQHECASCHNGKIAFAVEADCGLCHQGIVNPKRVLVARKLEPITLPKGENSPGPVTFNHDTHTADESAKCSICHSESFPMKKSAENPERRKMLSQMHEPKFCGMCHNGKSAFNWQEDCMMCHKGGWSGY